MNIGNAIKRIRLEKGISQGELADLVEISQTSLSQIEGGIKRPSAKNLTKICKALKVPETIVYFYGLEATDVPKKKKELYQAVYPALEDMIKKLLVD